MENPGHFSVEINNVSVGLNTHGHPDAAQLQQVMRDMLKNEILAKSENV
jgi:predicted Rdx family selenoprotein